MVPGQVCRTANRRLTTNGTIQLTAINRSTLKERLHDYDRRLATACERGGLWPGLYEFLWFGLKQAWASLFGGLMLLLILGSYLLYPRDAWLGRYDFLTLAAVALQIGLLRAGLETAAEARTILVFHVVGTLMEIFKTAMGSWIYPEAAVLRIGGVPLFTGFMYAAVGSYIARAWRLFDLRYTGHPPLLWLMLLAAAVYVNFFSHHFLPDIRLLLFIAVVWLFRRTWVYFRVRSLDLRMPLLLGFVLIALFIWIAENVGTFAGAWVYPSQQGGWSPVSLGKMGAWFLLMIISYSLVAALHAREGEQGRQTG